MDKSVKNINTQELKKVFKGRGEMKGYKFSQIAMNDFAFIYEKRWLDSLSITYEVFERRINKRFDTISYPSSKSFGIWAFDVATLDKAVIKFYELTKRVKNR